MEPETQTMVLLCCCCAFTSYADRAFLSVTIMPMSVELGWDLDDRAAVMAAFYPGYATTQIAGAWLSLVLGPKRVLVSSMVMWSLITIATPTAARTSVDAACWVRSLLGLFEGVTFPVMFHFLSPWLRSTDHGTAVGWINVGSGMGAVAAFAITPTILESCGWESVFTCFGIFGLGVAAAWATLAKDKLATPTANSTVATATTAAASVTGIDHSGGAPVDHAGSNAAASAARTMAALLAMGSHRSVLAIVVCHFCNAFGGFMMLSWLPTILHELFGMSGLSLWVSCLPWLGIVVGAFCGGRLADRLTRDGVPTLTARKIMCGCGFAGGAAAMGMLCLGTGWLPLSLALTLIFTERLLVTAGSVGGYEACKFDIAAGHHAGLLQGLSNTAGALGGVAVRATAAIVAGSWGWAGLFLALAVAYSAAVVVFATFADTKRVFQ